MSAGRSFLAGAIGVGLCWLLVPWYADMANQHLLSSKMANLFQLPSYVLVLAVSCLIGFLTGGLGSWTAACLRKVVFPKPTTPEGTRN